MLTSLGGQQSSSSHTYTCVILPQTSGLLSFHPYLVILSAVGHVVVIWLSLPLQCVCQSTYFSPLPPLSPPALRPQ